LALSFSASAQGLSAGTISGVVVDPNNAVVPNATVTLFNAVTGYSKATNTDKDGAFRFDNVPPNPYELYASAAGFASVRQRLEVRSAVPLTVKVPLTVGATTAVVNISSNAAAVIENDPSAHVDVDKSFIDKLPAGDPGSGLSTIVTLSAGGVAADSNGGYHPLGDHFESNMSLDNQPISDQQSKFFSTQIPVNAIQSIEVITGAVPSEFGDKTSLVVNAITRSGLNQNKPNGSINASYGTFGTTHEDASIAYGTKKVGNFTAFNFERSRRFLDAPEFTALNDRGTAVNLFDRIDYSPSAKNTFHLNVFLARNDFQTPNTFDQQAAGQAQRQLVNTINLAPAWVHIFGSTTVLSVTPYYRLDVVKYFPSSNIFSDQPLTFGESRRLNNYGVKADLSYVKGKHNAKFGAQIYNTALTEGFHFGITDPNFNDPVSPDFLPGLLQYDLTRAGSQFQFHGHRIIKQQAAFAQDSITLGNATIMLGARFDNYNGITKANLFQPRVGISYLVKRTNTVLRASYARVLETPFNENLILSDTGCNVPVIAALVPCVPANFSPGWRNEFHAGLEQAFGKYLVVSGEYIWKYTHNSYDFSILGATPITFPIEWHNSKIPGYAVRISVPNYKGFTALTVFSGVAARFFPPQVGGLGVTVGQSGGPFRIDHDEKFNQTTHLQYQLPMKHGPWVGFNWRYDSGLVAGAVPFATDTTTPVDLTGFTADQQLQIGLHCGNVFPTLSSPLTSCAPDLLAATRVQIPAPGTENDDKNPPRIAPRHLFDLAVGHDNIFGSESRYKVGLQFTAVNLTNQKVLYNFLSTFSGTHFVTPRAFTAEVTFHF